MIRIFAPTFSQTNGSLEVRSKVSLPGKDGECFFSLPEEFAHFVDTTRTDCFLVGFLYPAMRLAEDLHIAGKVSARLLFNVNEYVVPLLTSCDSRLKPIAITADETDVTGFPGAKAVTTGFSGGVDSFHAILDYSEPNTQEGFRLTHLLSFNVGAHGLPRGPGDLEAIEAKFHARYQKLLPCATELGLPFLPVNSNLHLFHPWGHLETNTLANVAAVLFLQRGIRRYYLASAGHPYHQLWQYLGNGGRPDDIAFLNGLLLPWLSTETTDLIEDGAQFDRSQKTARIADYPLASKYLNVCCNYDTLDTNCSVCDKCCRTLLTLELLGKIQNFDHVFDLEKYRREARRYFIAQTIAWEHKSLYCRHLMDLSREKGINLRKEVSFLELFRAKHLDGPLHQLIKKTPLLRKLAKTLLPH